MISMCGVYCEECPHFEKVCAGCDQIKGKVYWAQYIGSDACPIYHCVTNKKFENCGDCSDMPCEIWFTLKDPDWTEEQHEQSIRDRQAFLKKLRDC